MTQAIDKQRFMPKNWIFVNIGDIVEVVRGASPRPKGDPRYFGGNIPWIMISDITKQKGRYISETRDKVTEEGAKKSRYLSKGTLILSNSGTVCVPKILAVDGCIHDGFVAFPNLNQGIHILYLYYWFEHIRPQIIQENKQGVTQVNLNTNIVKNIKIKLPPVNEQRRIVSKLEELFTKLDAGIEYLKETQILLKQYHQSVLKYAFEGKLTEKWRKEHEDKIKPASLILKKIETVRKSRPIQNQHNKRELFNHGYWIWSTLSDLVLDYKNDIVDGPFGSNLHKSEYVESGRPIIRLQNIDRNRFINKNIRYISVKKSDELRRHNYKSGDILITKLGEPLGKACLVPENIQSGIVVADVVRMRIGQRDIFNKYVMYALNSPAVINQFPRPKGTTRPRVNLNHIREIMIPLCPTEEQLLVSKKIETIFSIIDNLEKVVEEGFVKHILLRQSILKNAFEGKLVPQDPNDEPAQILLERIKQKRELIIPVKEKTKIKKSKSIHNDGKQMRLI